MAKQKSDKLGRGLLYSSDVDADAHPWLVSRTERLRHHVRSHKWAYTAGSFVLSALVIVIIALFAIYPAIAQAKVNAADVAIAGIAIRNFTPDSFDMAINASVTNPSSIHPTLQPFTASVALADGDTTPFAHLPFPEIKAAGTVAVNISTAVHVTDENRAALVNFNKVLLREPQFRLTTAGRAAMTLGRMPRVHISFAKTLTLNGMNGLQGATTSNLSLSLFPDAQGYNSHALINIPDPSLITMDIGNVTLDQTLNDVSVGSADLYIKTVPGNNNTIPASIKTNPGLLGMLTQRPYCETGIIPVQAVPTMLTYNGQHIDYVLDALKTVSVTLSINVKEAIKKAAGIDLQCFGGASTGLPLASSTPGPTSTNGPGAPPPAPSSSAASTTAPAPSSSAPAGTSTSSPPGTSSPAGPGASAVPPASTSAPPPTSMLPAPAPPPPSSSPAAPPSSNPAPPANSSPAPAPASSSAPAPASTAAGGQPVSNPPPPPGPLNANLPIVNQILQRVGGVLNNLGTDTTINAANRDRDQRPPRVLEDARQDARQDAREQRAAQDARSGGGV